MPQLVKSLLWRIESAWSCTGLASRGCPNDGHNSRGCLISQNLSALIDRSVGTGVVEGAFQGTLSKRGALFLTRNRWTHNERTRVSARALLLPCRRINVGGWGWMTLVKRKGPPAGPRHNPCSHKGGSRLIDDRSATLLSWQQAIYRLESAIDKASFEPAPSQPKHTFLRPFVIYSR